MRWWPIEISVQWHRNRIGFLVQINLKQGSPYTALNHHSLTPSPGLRVGNPLHGVEPPLTHSHTRAPCGEPLTRRWTTTHSLPHPGSVQGTPYTALNHHSLTPTPGLRAGNPLHGVEPPLTHSHTRAPCREPLTRRWTTTHSLPHPGSVQGTPYTALNHHSLTPTPGLRVGNPLHGVEPPLTHSLTRAPCGEPLTRRWTTTHSLPHPGSVWGTPYMALKPLTHSLPHPGSVWGTPYTALNHHSLTPTPGLSVGNPLHGVEPPFTHCHTRAPCGESLSMYAVLYAFY